MNGRSFLNRWVIRVLGFVASVGVLTAAPEGPETDKLFEQLGADEFADRRAAQEELVEWGKQDLEKRVAFFQEREEAAEDPEVRERCRAIIRELVMQLLDQNRPGFIGIRMGGILLGPGQREPARKGIQVAQVIEGTAADKFGLQAGDVILKIDAIDVSGPDGTSSLQSYVSGKTAGTEIELQLVRGKETLALPLTLMKRPWDADLQRKIPFNGQQLGRPLTEEALREREYQKWLRESKKRPKSGQ